MGRTYSDTTHTVAGISCSDLEVHKFDCNRLNGTVQMAGQHEEMHKNPWGIFTDDVGEVPFSLTMDNQYSDCEVISILNLLDLVQCGPWFLSCRIMDCKLCGMFI